MESELRTTQKYVSVKEAAAYVGCSEDAIRDLYRDDPLTYRGVRYIGGYRCCIEDIEQHGDAERIRRNNHTSLKSDAPATVHAYEVPSRIPKVW
ncbi:MAG: hypothetical protein ACYC2X_11315 [Coriobacteriia bacterium]